jgi:hypothetical protein
MGEWPPDHAPVLGTVVKRWSATTSSPSSFPSTLFPRAAKRLWLPPRHRLRRQGRTGLHGHDPKDDVPCFPWFPFQLHATTTLSACCVKIRLQKRSNVIISLGVYNQTELYQELEID